MPWCVAVNCAGRTRSIIGAQALINAGVPNKVVSLANGTMDWLINGYTLQEGAYNFPALPTGAALEKAKASGERLRGRFGLKIISREELAELQADRSRSLYVFDVRTHEEYLAGHLPDSHWAEGGQLVQGFQRWVGTQNARIVLTDSADLVRASISASWLVQINWAAEVYIACRRARRGSRCRTRAAARSPRRCPRSTFLSPAGEAWTRRSATAPRPWSTSTSAPATAPVTFPEPTSPSARG